ncbi:uncharacterized protein K02A2.6-like [Aplysia californica]|uniref:Uncharacterized protein K02A2.6-like n=1 Tax=Aplysia californica TaxID=6500 RepID=A0ABM0K597_APLCA|nr:uncharacterized protein K02A2.6-like [Aplysia californica]
MLGNIRRSAQLSTLSALPCHEHQKLPPKQPSRPWITPDEPWSRVRIDHAINFRSHNWMVMVDAFSKYLMSSITTKATTRRLDEDFAHFGYPHAIVTENATCFSSAEFQTWCEQRGILHLHGAPYHPEFEMSRCQLVVSAKTAHASRFPTKVGVRTDGSQLW